MRISGDPPPDITVRAVAAIINRLSPAPPPSVPSSTLQPPPSRTGPHMYQTTSAMFHPSVDQPRVIPVCECFDDRSFGLSRAADAFTANLPGISIPAAISLKPLSGREPPAWNMVSFDMSSMMRMPARGIVDQAIACRADIVHFHGIWTMAIKEIAHLKEHGIRVVVSPHGMLEDYIINRHRLRKWLFSALVQRKCLGQADAIHALSEHERTCIQRYVGTSVPIQVIPNGVERVDTTDEGARPDHKRQFLFMGRLHEKKRLDLLLDAWMQASITEEAELVIAGSGEGPYADRIIARCKETMGVRYLGYLSGPERAQCQAQSTFGILTSLSEGQPMGILESLACGRPCIVSTGCRMPMISEERLGWVGDEVSSIAEALRSACYVPPFEYRSMVKRCRAYVRKHHDWHANSRRLSELYRQLAPQATSRTPTPMRASG